MAFQRSYSKVWWGSDNQSLSLSSVGGGGGGTSLPPTLNNATHSTKASAAATGGSNSNFHTGGFYYGSYFSRHTPQQQQQQQLQLQQQQQQRNAYSGYHSLDSSSYRTQAGNLSRIQEVDDEQNSSRLSWGKRDSPGSLRSQDSGFSDNDESHSTRSLGRNSSKSSSPGSKSTRSARSVGSPTSVHSASTIATPPTVVRRVGKSEFYSPLVSVSRRISFTGSPSTTAALDAAIASGVAPTTHDTCADVPRIVVTESAAAKKLNFDDADVDATELATATVTTTAAVSVATIASKQPKRRRRISRQATKPLSPTKRRTLLHADSDQSDVEEAAIDVHVQSDADDGASDAASTLDELERTAERNRSRTRLHIVPAYNNETVYLGAATTNNSAALSYNNETVLLGSAGTNSATHDDTNNNTLKLSAIDDVLASLQHDEQRQMGSTSTPKTSPTTHAARPWAQMSLRQTATRVSENPLLNGHAPDLQHWLHKLRWSCEPEVMSTLQTKSIAQEAFKNLTITTSTVAKLIRQLQQRALYMQSDFERIERILTGAQEASLHEALASAEQLLVNVAEFTNVLERRVVFFNETRVDRKRYEENLAQIRLITKDSRYSLEHQHYINLESLLDDVHVLKRYLLISVRQVFEKMVRIIVQSVEQGRCDLMLRANMNMIATLMNIDYDGFASLTDAFVQNEAVRALLIVCLEHRLSSVRALALRALATICCSPAAIAQLSASGGVEIVRDIVQLPGKERAGELKRGDIERREAVSLLTQITAAWHGPDHRVDGLKDCAEIIVEGLTQLITYTNCTQTLLLCAAALNNLSRMEITSHYSIMSNEAIFKLIEAVQRRDEDVTVFLYEQIVAMLHNMSVNKKCHSHLANGSIINFITSAYQTEFYKRYESRAESDAQRRTVKAILHTLTHLVHESSLGVELLEQHRVPAFFRQAMLIGGGGPGVSGASGEHSHAQWPLESSHSRDISALARQLLQSQRQERQAAQQTQSAAHDGATMSHATATTASGGSVGNVGSNGSSAGSGSFKFNLTRQESFV